MQVGRVYKLILLVLVLVVVGVVVMWGRGDDVTETESPEGLEVAEISDDTDFSELFAEDSRDSSDVLPNEVPPEVSIENPYFENSSPIVDPLEGFEEVEGFRQEEAGDTAEPEADVEVLEEDLPQADTRYKVQPGDSLEKISRKFYGTVTAWKRIADANGISNPRSLKVGQKLLIPQGKARGRKLLRLRKMWQQKADRRPTPCSPATLSVPSR
ncbi:MAG: LysM peptidoglycan-binding domain-containing protein [Planctomycetota bacterium]|nr:LysM peptidoglycan-binding domain-containing protein [Planctomycetota bacterium]